MKRLILAIWCTCIFGPAVWGQQTPPPIQWQATYGGTINDILHCLQQTSDGGYIIGGRSIALPGGGTKTAPSYGNYDYWLIRVDANGNQLWDRSYGGIMYDALRSLRQTADGGFLLAGYTESPAGGNKTSPYIGARNYWVVRTDSTGNKLWERAYGGTGGDTLAAMRPTPDGGYILAGTSTSSPGGTKTAANYGWNSRDFWIVRINATGDTLWDRSFGSTGEDDLHSIELTADGGFILGGTSPVGPSGNKTSESWGGPDYWLIRLDANGDKLWEKSYGGWGTDDLYSVVPTSDGGFMLGGYSDSPPSGNRVSTGFGGVDLWVVRVDASGNKLWDRCYGGDANDGFMDTFTMQPTTDGGFILGTGTGGSSANGNKTAPNYGANDMWVVRIDAAGNKLWDQSFGASDTDVVNAIQQTADGGFIFGGQSYSDRSGNKTAARQGGADYWVVKLGTSAPVVNQLPTLSSVSNQTIDEDQTAGPIAFTVGDTETPAASLTITARSSNQALLTDTSIEIGGASANRTVVLRPLTNQFGSATITLVVVDAHQGRATNSFLLTVRPVDDPPSIGQIPPLFLGKNSAATLVSVLIGDAETPSAQLTLAAVSSQPAVVPASGLVLEGSGAERTLRLTPAPNQVGTTLITLTVGDGTSTRTSSFEVSVQEVLPIHPNLVSHWKLDEASGNVALDLTGRNPGTLVNAPERVPGRMGSALRFNGLNNYVNIPDSDSLDLGSRMSISFWFKPSTLLNAQSGRKDLFKKFVAYWLLLNYPANDGKLAFVLNSGAPILTSTTTQWLADRWYHVAATYDGTFMRLYIDGVLENSLAVVVTPMMNAYPVQIGGNSEQSIFFPGAIDDVRLHNAPLSAAEVMQLAGSPPVSANAAPQISAVPNQTIEQNKTAGPITLTVSDSDTDASLLTLRGQSSDPSLVLDAGISFAGSGASRTVTITPVVGKVGTCQITLWVSDGTTEQSAAFTLTVVTTNTPGSENAYVISTVPGSLRNDFTGWVGYRMTVGANPIQVTALGRFAYPGDQQSHVVKIVRASTGVDLPGASITLSMSGAATGQWKFAPLSSPVTLAPGEALLVLSEERAGGDHFADLNTTIQTTEIAVQNSAVYGAGGPNYINVAGPSRTYGPPNFRYQQSGAPPVPTAPTVTWQEPIPGTFTLPVQITLRAAVSAGVTNTVFLRDTIPIGNDNHHPATIIWVNPPVGTYALTARVTDTNGQTAVSDPISITVRTNGGAAQNFIVSKVLGEVRQDFSGWVGMKITVGPQALSVKEVGRIIVAGNSGTHLVKFVRASDLVELSSSAINTLGGTAGEFKYEPLATSLVLAPHTMYYLVSQEVSGSDRWHGVVGTTVTTLDVAAVNSGVFMGGGYGWSLAGSSQHSYGPVDFKFEPISQPMAGGTPSSMVTEIPTRLKVFLLDGQLLLTLDGLEGQHYSLEASDDLLHWVTIAEHVLERDQVTLIDVEARSSAFRFYRATPVPRNLATKL